MRRFQSTKNKAFTLAEVLITIGIIGIVAAITIPTLINEYQAMVTKNRWKKAYAELNNAFQLVKADENVSAYFNCTAYNCTDPLVAAILAKYNNLTNINTTANSTYLKYKSITDVQWSNTAMIHNGYNTMSGMTIYYWSYYPGGCTFYIDINGEDKKPNTVGKDLFAAEIANEKIVPWGVSMRLTGGDGSTKYNISGDWCNGVGSGTIAGFVQSVDHSNYAGLGCSYEYLKD